jgi:hypothetical protein
MNHPQKGQRMSASPPPPEYDGSLKTWQKNGYGSRAEWIAWRKKAALTIAVDFLWAHADTLKKIPTINGKPIPIRNIDAWLWLTFKEVPPHASRAERAEHRKWLLAQLRLVSLDQDLMQIEGFEPFEIHFKPGEWHVVSASEYTKLHKPLSKSRSQTKTSLAAQRRLLRALNRTQSEDAHAEAVMELNLIAICSDVADTVYKGYEKYKRDMTKIKQLKNEMEKEVTTEMERVVQEAEDLANHRA